MNRGAERIFLSWVLLFAMAACGFAQTTKPASPTTLPAQVQGIFENRQIERSGSAPAAKADAAGNKTVPALSTDFSVTRVVLALGLVIVVIFLLRWIAQQLFGMPTAKKSSRAVQVLSRSVISPKQHVLLLKIGQRVIVVGDSGQQMNPLCQITDPDEVASLIGQLREDRTDPVSKAFGTIFGKAEKEYDGEEASAAAEKDQDSEVDPSLATTKAELSGLMEKVRSAARQLGQG